MKTSVPVAESIPGDADRPLTPMDVDEEGTDDEEREILIKLIPSVVETMKNHGQLETWILFNLLLSTQSFPMDNIAFLLFLDVVRWYGTSSTTKMRYNDTAVGGNRLCYWFDFSHCWYWWWHNDHAIFNL